MPTSYSVRFLQVGDFYELWAGLKYAHNAPLHVRRFVRCWVSEIENDTSAAQKAAISKTRSLAKLTGGAVLRGNHDDYLSRPDAYWNGGLFVEHGHAGDSWNNSSGRWKGHAITQGVTLYPTVRGWEDPFSGFLSAYVGAEPRRLTFVRHALDACVPGLVTHSNDRYGIYVMGHTHRACVKRLHVRVGNPDQVGLITPPFDKKTS